ncbi:MAG TPA: hypothetical protein VKG45_10130 [Actinomycetes bacterium]|nr:hypothetical protein [Actinomycetes bacterium]
MQESPDELVRETWRQIEDRNGIIRRLVLDPEGRGSAEEAVA